MEPNYFLKTLLDTYVSIAELITSVARSGNTSLSIQNSARVLIACIKPSLERATPKKLDNSGLPEPDEQCLAMRTLERVASFQDELSLAMVRESSDYISLRHDCQNFGFGSDIWELISESGLTTSLRVDTSACLRENILLACLPFATPREIAFYLVPEGYKAPNIIKALRSGYDSSKISAAEPKQKSQHLEIDEPINLEQAALWLSSKSIVLPIPRLIKISPSRTKEQDGAPHTNNHEMGRLLLENDCLRERIDQLESLLDRRNAGSTELTFPYATKELKAMHAAAVKYWKDYTPAKRQPTQKEIGIELCELLGLPRQANNDPARKAIALASAIKPDALLGT